MSDSDYDKFAREYSDSMGEEGDYFHKTQIDPHLYKIIGDPNGKTIYDLGCGNGYMARNLARKGARVIASDISPELIKIAQEKSRELNINYSVREGTDFEGFEDGQFDVVVMNMVIHYIDDLDKLFEGISRVLKPGGAFAFSTNHFLRPTTPYSEWEEGTLYGGKKLFIKLTNYLKTYTVTKKSKWDKTTELGIINRPLNEFVNKMSKKGLYMNEVYEPESVGFATDFSEELQKSHHIPTFIIIGVIKK